MLHVLKGEFGLSMVGWSASDGRLDNAPRRGQTPANADP
jgi:hypothetical protein